MLECFRTVDQVWHYGRQSGKLDSECHTGNRKPFVRKIFISWTFGFLWISNINLERLKISCFYRKIHLPNEELEISIFYIKNCKKLEWGVFLVPINFETKLRKATTLSILNSISSINEPHSTTLGLYPPETVELWIKKPWFHISY